MKLLLPICRLATALLLWLPLASFAQMPAPTPTETVFAGVPQETIAGEAPEFKLFDPKFYDNQLFFLGESHGVQRPQELDFALLKHLNERAGVRTYVAEVDCAQSPLPERVPAHGPGQHPAARVSQLGGHPKPSGATRSSTTKSSCIRALNQTLPAAARRIRFIGLDQLAGFAAGRRLPAPPCVAASRHALPPLRAQLDSVHDPAAGTTRAMARPGRPGPARQPHRSWSGPAGAGAAAGLGAANNYAELELLLRNLGLRAAGPEAAKRRTVRQLRSVSVPGIKQLAHEKLYGMWGLAHVLQSPVRRATLCDAWRPASDKARCRCTPRWCRCCACSAAAKCCFPRAGLPAPWQTAGPALVRHRQIQPRRPAGGARRAGRVEAAHGARQQLPCSGSTRRAPPPCAGPSGCATRRACRPSQQLRFQCPAAGCGLRPIPAPGARLGPGAAAARRAAGRRGGPALGPAHPFRDSVRVPLASRPSVHLAGSNPP